MEANESTRPRGFQPGNKLSNGRPIGSRNAVQLVLEQIGRDNVENVYDVMLNQALNGSFEAAKYILDKFLPNAKGNYVNLPLPKIDSLEKVAEAQDTIVQHLSNGAITPDDAGKIFDLIECRRKTNDMVENSNMFNQIAFGISNGGV